MELSDYDLLGVTQNSSFRLIKNAYHDLSRIYHPDSSQIIYGMSKKDKINAFQRIQTAFDNIKKKLNVVEVDVPDYEIEYNIDISNPIDYELEELKEEGTELKEAGTKLKEISTKIEKDFEKDTGKKQKEERTKTKLFNEKFNKIFEKNNIKQNNDNPYSIHYKTPEESKRNLPDSKIILKEAQSIQNSNIFEFGINYIHDHSTNKYLDINKLEDNAIILDENYKINEINENNKIKQNDKDCENSENSKDIEPSQNSNNNSNELNKKFEELLKLRNEKIKTNEEDIAFISRQKQIQKEIQESKYKIQESRNQSLLK